MIWVDSGILPVREAIPQEGLDMRTHIPTSQTISEVSGDDRIRPRISQECMTVSPLRRAPLEIALKIQTLQTFEEMIHASIATTEISRINCDASRENSCSRLRYF